MYDWLTAPDRFPGASADAIAKVEDAIGTRLPVDYRDFLQVSDGYNGDVGSKYLVLWSVGELASLATGYDMLPAGPEQVLIGSNGGPTAFAIVDGRYVSIPFASGMEDMRVLADTFDGFLTAIAAGEGW